MVGDNLDLVGISSKSGNQSGHLVGVELEDEIPGGGNGTMKVTISPSRHLNLIKVKIF